MIAPEIVGVPASAARLGGQALHDDGVLITIDELHYVDYATLTVLISGLEQRDDRRVGSKQGHYVGIEPRCRNEDRS